MERTPPRFIPMPEGQPVQQAQTVAAFCSPERPGITPIFGTVQPPQWMSGAIRRLAYKLPENDLRHWLMLITEAKEADEIIAGGNADLVLLGRELLREPSGKCN